MTLEVSRRLADCARVTEEIAGDVAGVAADGVPWAHYEAHLALRGDAAVPRMAYLEGALELMSPSKDRERIKSLIGRLVEAYAFERGIEPHFTLNSAFSDSPSAVVVIRTR